MRIVIDMQSCQSGSRFGGIGRYSINLVAAMGIYSKHEIHIVVNNYLTDGVPEMIQKLSRVIDRDNIHIFQIPFPVATTNNETLVDAGEIIREQYIAKLNPDAILITSLFEGGYEEVVVSVHKLYKDIFTAVILYDLIPYQNQETFLKTEDEKKAYFHSFSSLCKADLLLSISEYSRQEAIKELKIAEEKIVNISTAVDARFKKATSNSELDKSWLIDRFRIEKSYIMFVGSFCQRKNQKGLIQAFAMLPKEIREKYQVVFVGNAWSGICNELLDFAKKNGLAENSVIFTMKIDDEDLLKLYHNCYLFVFPSLLEGFGIPVLEAMSCGIPTIGSNTTSIPEIIGNRSAMFDPLDASDIAKKLLRGLEDLQFREKLIDEGLYRAKEFSWKKTAETAISAIEKMIQKSDNKRNKKRFTVNQIIQRIVESYPKITDFNAEKIARCIETTVSTKVEKRIAWITTWNSRCGIACDNSKHLIGSRKNEVVILAPNDEKLESLDEENVIRCWSLRNNDYSQIYNQVVQKELWRIIIQFNLGFYDYENFRKLIFSLINSGRAIIIILHATREDVVPEKKIELLKDAFTMCNKILVHTEIDRMRLSRIGIENVCVFPLGIYEPKSKRKKSDVIVSREFFNISSYGFFVPHKGLVELLNAINILVKQGRKVKLYMINAEYTAAPISKQMINNARKYVKENNLDKNVYIRTDFLQEEDILSILRQTDLVVFPYTTGDSSSGAVRMGLNSGVPVAVSPHEIFDDVSEIVVRLQGTSPMEIASGIEAIMDGKVEIEKIQKNAQKWCDERRFPNMSMKLFKMISSIEI